MPRQARLDFHVAGMSPTQVADAIRVLTRRYQRPWAVPPGYDSEHPLVGIVGEEQLHLSLHDGVRGIRSTARLRLEPSVGGTRVFGKVGLPPAVTWMLRFAVVLGVGLSVMVLAAGIAYSSLLPPVVGVAVLAVAVAIAGINVARANADLPAVTSGVESIVSGVGPALAATRHAAAEAESSRKEATDRLIREGKSRFS